MATLVRSSYYLDDWDRINDSYNKYLASHGQQITTLEQWIAKQPHLPKLPKPTLGLYLHWSRGSTEAAKELIESQLTLRTQHPDFFVGRFNDYKRVQQILDLGEMGVVEPWDKTLDGLRLIFGRVVDTDATKLDFHLLCQIFTAGFDFEMARVGLYVKGIVVVLDMAGFHLGYIPKINLMDVAITLKFFRMFEQLLAGVHVINCDGLISQIMALIRPFLSKELAAKLHFHTPNQMDNFFKHVPKEYVPSTYGGELESMTELNAQFRKRFNTAETWLKSLESQEWQVRENLKPVINGEEEMKGSFRKLCID